jgi:hypothetical protein
MILFRPRTPPIHIVKGGYQPWNKRRPPKRASWTPIVLGFLGITGCCTLTLGAANLLLIQSKPTPAPVVEHVQTWTPDNVLLQPLTSTMLQGQ